MLNKGVYGRVGVIEGVNCVVQENIYCVLFCNDEVAAKRVCPKMNESCGWAQSLMCRIHIHITQIPHNTVERTLIHGDSKVCFFAKNTTAQQ